MTGPPSRALPPLGLVALAGLLVLAVGGAAVGALTRDAPVPSAAGAVATTPPATSTPTPPVVAGGSAWPADTPTPVPTATLVPPTPTSSPSASIEASLEICRGERDGRCTDRVDRVGDDGFVAILTFDGAAAGDTFVFRLEGPDGRTVSGASIAVNGGAGRAWSTFRGGLARGGWVAIVTRDGAEVARAAFEAR